METLKCNSQNNKEETTNKEVIITINNNKVEIKEAIRNKMMMTTYLTDFLVQKNK